MKIVFRELYYQFGEALPFMGEQIKLSIQLTHGDGFWIQDIGQGRLEFCSGWWHFSFEWSLGILQHLVTLKKTVVIKSVSDIK